MKVSISFKQGLHSVANIQGQPVELLSKEEEEVATEMEKVLERLLGYRVWIEVGREA